MVQGSRDGESPGRGEQTGRGLSGSRMQPWLPPCMGGILTLVSPRASSFGRPGFSQPEAQASSSHGRTRPGGTLGKPVWASGTRGGRHRQPSVKGVPCARLCVKPRFTSTRWLRLWENPKMEERWLSPFYRWGSCCLQEIDECPRSCSQKVGNWDGEPRSTDATVQASCTASDQSFMTGQEAAEGGPSAYDAQEKMPDVDTARRAISIHHLTWQFFLNLAHESVYKNCVCFRVHHLGQNLYTYTS